MKISTLIRKLQNIKKEFGEDLEIKVDYFLPDIYKEFSIKDVVRITKVDGNRFYTIKTK